MAKRTREEWKKLIEELERSGETLVDFAERRSIRPKTLAWWKSALKRLGRGPKRRGRSRKSRQIEFLPVSLSRPEIVDATIEISVADIVLRFPQGTSAEYVGSVLLEIRALC